MEYKKFDDKSVEQTFKQIVFKDDLLREEETLEARLVVVKAMLKTLE